MPLPALLIGLPLMLGPVIYGLRRWRYLEVGLAAGAPFGLLLLLLALPLDQPLGWLNGVAFASTFDVLGRAFVIEPVTRLALAFIFGQAALLFLGASVTHPGRFYLPAGQLIVGLLVAALCIRPFLFAALFMHLASALAVFMLADERHAQTRGALRQLTFATLSLPFILLSGWLLERNTGSALEADTITRVTLFLALGFAISLSVAPFHSWIPMVAESAYALAAAFVFSSMRFVTVFLLINFLNTYPWLGQSAAIYQALTLAGGGMVLLGTLFIFGQRNFGRSLGYAVLIDIGATLLALGLGTLEGLEAALAVLVARGIALTLWAVGLDQVRHLAGGDDFDAVTGLARSHPFAAAAVVAGLLSLAGFPLTAGFPGRWALLRLLAQIHPTAALLLLVGMASIAFVAARGIAALIMPAPSPVRRIAETRPTIILYSFGFAVLLTLGLFPQWLLPVVANTADVFSTLARSSGP